MDEEIYYVTPQTDDGDRNALKHFLESRDFKTAGLIAFCAKHKEFWKARVFLELLWEYEAKDAEIEKLKGEIKSLTTNQSELYDDVLTHATALAEALDGFSVQNGTDGSWVHFKNASINTSVMGKIIGKGVFDHAVRISEALAAFKAFKGEV